MARKSSSTTVQEELYPPPGEGYDRQDREELDDARLVDLDVEEESPFLRGQKRVSARRGPLPKKAVHWIKWVGVAGLIVLFGSLAGAAVYRYGEHSWRFRIDSSDNIEISGIHNVTHAQVMEVVGGDIGRNIFFIPLAERKAQLEKIPWAESASVMRFVPNRLTVEIHERTPVAFARIGSRIMLIDSGGTLMELPGPGKQKYSFPVIVGMNPGEPLSTREARMRIYNDLVRQLDSDGSRYSQALSEVDITDPDDVKVQANDSAGAVLVHLGSNDYLNRYRIYVTHIQGWRQQFERLESVDLRYDKQIIVNPDMEGMPKAAPLTQAAAQAAMAAGVKSAALIHVVSSKPAPTMPPAKSVTGKNTPKTAAKPVSKPATHKAAKSSHPPAHDKKAAKAPAVHAAAKTVPAASKTQTTHPGGGSAPAPVSTAPSKKPSAAIAKAAPGPPAPTSSAQASSAQAQKSAASQDHP